MKFSLLHLIFSISTLLQGCLPGSQQGTTEYVMDCGHRVEMLKFWEASLHNQEIISPEITSEDTAKTILSGRFGRHFWMPNSVNEEKLREDISSQFSAIFSKRPVPSTPLSGPMKIKFSSSIPLGSQMFDMDYALRDKIPSNCKIRQIAYFPDLYTDSPVVIESLWDKLDFRSKAVMASHLIIYSMGKRLGLTHFMPETDGTEISAVGESFLVWSSMDRYLPTPMSFDLPDLKKIKICSDSISTTNFYAFESRSGSKLIFLFNSIGGYKMQSRRVISFKEKKLIDIQSDGQFFDESLFLSTSQTPADNFSHWGHWIRIRKYENEKTTFELNYLNTDDKRLTVIPETVFNCIDLT